MAADAQLPLAGVRILEPGQAWALPFAITPLAALGAQVIKIEAPIRPEARADGGSSFHELNRNKLGLGLDLRTETGLRIFRELVAISDVVAENFPPRVMHNFGLDYPALKAIKPDIIYLSSTAYGSTGEWRNYTAYGPNIEAAVGLMHVTGYADGPPSRSGVAYSDIVAAYSGTLAILAALAYRRRTGKGQWIDLSQYEAGVAQMGAMLLGYQFTGENQGRWGNHHPVMAPHQAYPCRGNDRWITIACRDEGDWQALRRAMGDPDWARDPLYQTADGRKACEEELDRRMGDWTAGHAAEELQERLQAAGVPAGVAQNGKDVLLNPHLRARGFITHLQLPEPWGRRPHFRAAWPLSGVDPGPDRPAPELGQDNHVVLRELLGYTPADIAALEEQKVVGNRPQATRPGGGVRPTGAAVGQLLALARIIEYDPDPSQTLGLR
ncbi:MAG: CoA transferase [Chloroflexi bacterium]|nr:CoA transferase [Chloroflexota bacterium]